MTSLEIDHFAIAAETLAEGVEYVQDTLGVTLSDVGHHAKMGTHNRLLSLGPSVYLEVIAIDPEAKPPMFPRWFDLDHFRGAPRLTNWICRTTNLPAALELGPEGSGEPMEFVRGNFHWHMGVPANGVLPYGGAFPAMISWHGDAHPCARLEDQECRLEALTLGHPEAPNLAATLAAYHITPEVQIETSGRPKLRLEVQTPSGTKVLA
ncbi:VOC family protein [Halocynthiibacter sp. C4]|uniref:VOC family protein n=1 Tax=Halocynthiibacter sp. C4 TaxID=2992758 RepID=UPI00237BC884|nr:VOC family protein [Halocynthiibacter sp. C4]MDE0590195.1 VOC family protein [Halocynthiibacter sp. C4]